MKTDLIKLTCPKCCGLDYRKMTKYDFMNEWTVRCKHCNDMYDANKVYTNLGEVIKSRITTTILYKDDVGADRIMEINEPW